MAKSVSILTIMIIMICPIASFAQGDFLESGQDGFQIAGQYTKTDNGNEVSGIASYSLDGVIDLGMSVGRMTYDNSGDILNGSFYGPLFAIHIRKKPANQLPVSISFIFNYAISSFPTDDDTFSSSNNKMTGDHYLMGVVFYRNFKESREFQIQPNGWIGYEYNKLQTEINGAPDDNSDDGVIYGFGLSILIGNPSKSGIRIDTGFTTYKKKTAFSITLGIIKIV